MRNTKWPKILPPLTLEQQSISDDFMEYWHDGLPTRYGCVGTFRHSYVLKHAPRGFVRTLEIGAGLGDHLAYERLSDAQRRHYVALELREAMAARIRARFPDVTVLVGDCQSTLEFSDGYFDRILALHVLEHLPNLPAAIKEMHRLCQTPHGVLSVVIPCEGGLAYSIARRLSAQRVFERRYHQPYQWFIEREHLNRPQEILEELKPHFRLIHRAFFPIPVPLVWCNLGIGMTLQPTR